MSDNNPSNGNGSAQAPEQAFMLQQLYVKDMSFESPNSPQIFRESNVEPETELNIRNSHAVIEDGVYEVVLHISVHAKVGENTIFLAEMDQGGIFAIRGYTQEQTAMLLGTQCPTTLFPYARESISSLVGKGGFPPLILQPINFEALYAQAQTKGQQAQA
ncbi:MAG: protein-export chaperone SecB [Gammaproteobacteria bacterium]|nr:protein-export chaperone SecB [Gammaproteobacteria bacterium]NND55540.1 protein-export chaperone SecB [Gammaproteobacteria bacterium]